MPRRNPTINTAHHVPGLKGRRKRNAGNPSASTAAAENGKATAAVAAADPRVSSSPSGAMMASAAGGTMEAAKNPSAANVTSLKTTPFVHQALSVIISVVMTALRGVGRAQARPLRPVLCPAAVDTDILQQ